MKKSIKVITTISIIILIITSILTSQILTNAVDDAKINLDKTKYSVPIGSTVIISCLLQTSKPIVSGEFSLKYPSNLKVENITTKNVSQAVKNDVKNENMVLMNFSNYGKEIYFDTLQEILNVEFKVVSDEEGNFKFNVINLGTSDMKELSKYSISVKAEFSQVTGSEPANEETQSAITENINTTSIEETQLNTTDAIEETEETKPKQTNNTNADATVFTEPTVQQETVSSETEAKETQSCIKSVEKKENPIKVTVKAKTLKAKKLKKKKQIVKPLIIKDAQGKVTVTKVKKGTNSKIYKKITVNKKNGTITLKKGKYVKKSYKIKLKITAKGNKTYNNKTFTKTVKVKIK